MFYLGTHKAHWLARTDMPPLFVSRRQLAGRATLPRAAGAWALDSGGFTELSMHGRWTLEPVAYVDEVRRYMAEVGNMQWAAIQDWMCEPWILKKTGLTVEEHQRLTLENYLLLRDMAPEVPWAPVLQGWRAEDYYHHVAMYEAAGVRLAALPIVGLGSVCRRQHTDEAEGFIRTLHSLGLRLHGFGFKLRGLANVHHLLASSDSLAWSFEARRRRPLPGCKGHKTCANCPRYALWWHARLQAMLHRERGRRDAEAMQLALF